jgi:hypothetical protein
MTPTRTYEEIRQLLIEQIEQIAGFRHARHLFTGVNTQGAVIGDRTFDVQVGTSRVISSARSGAEQVEAVFRIRLRHRASLLQGAPATATPGVDRDRVERVLRTTEGQIPDDIRVRWPGTAEPKINVPGFLDTDIQIECGFWRQVTAPPEAAAAGSVS